MLDFNQDSLNNIRTNLGDTDFVSVCRSLAVANLVESEDAEPEDVIQYFKDARNFLDSVLDVSDELFSDSDDDTDLEEDDFGCCCCHCCADENCVTGDDDDDILEEPTYCQCSSGGCDGCHSCFRHGCPIDEDINETLDELDIDLSVTETPPTITTYRVSTSGLE